MLSSYSYSSLESFRICPRQFKFRYIDKVSREKKMNAPAIMGGIVHRALEQLYRHGADGVLYPKDDIIAFYDAEWKKLPIEQIQVESAQYTIDDFIRIGREVLEAYYNDYQPFNQDQSIGTELNLRFTLPQTNYTFSARIDRLAKRNDGVVEIIDYKTGQRLPTVNDAGFYFQMGLYQLALMENYPQFKDIELVQYFLRHKEAIRLRLREDQLDEFQEEVRQAVRETIHASKTDTFPTKESSFCNFCDYYDICPAKIHKQMLEQESSELQGELSPEKIKDVATKYIRKNQEAKVLEDEVNSLKAQLIEIAREYNMNVLEGEDGQVRVALKNEEKFVTKSANKNLFADFSAFCREHGLDDFFQIDGPALMKEGVIKGRLTTELVEQLQQFMIAKESSRVTIKKNKPDNNDGTR